MSAQLWTFVLHLRFSQKQSIGLAVFTKDWLDLSETFGSVSGNFDNNHSVIHVVTAYDF